jgi:hypothetical protein
LSRLGVINHRSTFAFRTVVFVFDWPCFRARLFQSPIWFLGNSEPDWIHCCFPFSDLEPENRLYLLAAYSVTVVRLQADFQTLGG